MEGKATAYFRSAFLLPALLCLGTAGCASASWRRGPSHEAELEGKRAGVGVEGRSAARAKALNEAEQRVAAVIERVMVASPTRPAHVRVTKTPERHRGRERPIVFAPRTLATNRSEPLPLMDGAGSFCAAVSIASRLGVTALHCVSALCDSADRRAMESAFPIGCQVPYGLPSGERALATVVASSENDLVALLELHRVQSNYGSLCCDDPRAEDPVYTVNRPAEGDWRITYGRLARDPVALEWVGGSSTRILVAEISTRRDSTGGGLFDIDDNLLGVQIARWSPWSSDFGKVAFIQANRIFSLAGQYCMQAGAPACVGLRCISSKYDIWSFHRI